MDGLHSLDSLTIIWARAMSTLLDAFKALSLFKHLLVANVLLQEVSIILLFLSFSILQVLNNKFLLNLL